ncbi:unnamed protein product [Protopolystoma xenopodis]|uniref:Uncharacterized protein n=1 Tax=Protopolystoma xenopodis TaxID=117903 RepID=A0A3S5A1V3_9PLAT|nr:unnamed protein product [Protopolystoma xenopodis]
MHGLATPMLDVIIVCTSTYLLAFSLAPMLLVCQTRQSRLFVQTLLTLGSQSLTCFILLPPSSFLLPPSTTPPPSSLLSYSCSCLSIHLSIRSPEQRQANVSSSPTTGLIGIPFLRSSPRPRPRPRPRPTHTRPLLPPPHPAYASSSNDVPQKSWTRGCPESTNNAHVRFLRPSEKLVRRESCGFALATLISPKTLVFFPTTPTDMT